jgi:hypothetical protein
MVKAAIFADDNNDMLDRRRSPDSFNRVLGRILIAPVVRANTLRNRKGCYGSAQQQ